MLNPSQEPSKESWLREISQEIELGMRCSTACAVAGSTLFIAGAALAAQWVVDGAGPADFSSINAALSSPQVQPGDTLIVRPGIYHETITLYQDFIIVSEAGPLRTVIDGHGTGSVVSLHDLTSATRIEGFTITGGRAFNGGGVYIDGGSPVITRNLIVGNTARYDPGYGVYGVGGYGGGVEVRGAAPIITRTVIRGNAADKGGGGLDLYCPLAIASASCNATVAENTITANSVTFPAGLLGGGGISSYSPTARISSNIILGNRAAIGGGMYVGRDPARNSWPVVTSNVLYGNESVDADSFTGWALPDTNQIADPRLGPGEGIDLSPRSDSPALDAAESGLPSGADFSGQPGPFDSNLDGVVAADIGALENRGEITELLAVPDPTSSGAIVLTWDGSMNPAITFDLYAEDGSPFVQDGGFCLASGLAVTTFTDDAMPAPGQVRYYLVAGKGATEGNRGFRSDGTPIPSSPSCPG